MKKILQGKHTKALPVVMLVASFSWIAPAQASLYSASAYGSDYQCGQIDSSHPSFEAALSAMKAYTNACQYAAGIVEDTCSGINPETLTESGQCNYIRQKVDNGQPTDRVGGVIRWAACPAGTEFVPSKNGCYGYRDIYLDEPPSKSCPPRNEGFGNPIYPLTGAKRQDVDLGIRIGGQAVTLNYDTRAKLPGASSGSISWRTRAVSSFGPLWASSLHKSMVLQGGQAGEAFSAVVMQRGGNAMSTAGVAGFGSCSGGGGGGGGSYRAVVSPSQQASYVGSAGRLVDEAAMTEEAYDTSGAVLSVSMARGGGLTYAYSDSATPAMVAPVPGLLIRVVDAFGHMVQFTYEQPSVPELAPRIVSIQRDQDPPIKATYDAVGNLSKLTWADGKVRTFLYERGDLKWALTGVVDENQKRHSTYGYDAEGRANST